MDSVLSWTAIVLIASFDVIGLIEWVKSLWSAILNAAKGTGKKSTILWPSFSFIFSAAVAVALGAVHGNDIFQDQVNAVVFSFLTILSFVELFGYNVLVRLVFALVDKLVGGSGNNSDMLEGK